MSSILPEPRKELSKHAPRVISIKIPRDKIRELIGAGGATIREITEATNCNIDINEDGMVTISAANDDDGMRAKEWVKNITADVELNKVYSGKVTKITNFCFMKRKILNIVRHKIWFFKRNYFSYKFLMFL